MKKIIILFLLLFNLGFSEDKIDFLDKIKIVVEAENSKIKEERSIVEKYFETEQKDIKEIISIKNKYKVTSINDKNEFLKKIDTIPPSLVLSQGAIESSWGRSYLSQKFNNFFGQKNKALKFAKFQSLEESVREYMLNLNTHFAYKTFREKRDKFKKENKDFSGLEASSTLVNYSEEKHEYIKQIKSVIKNHNLLSFDKEPEITTISPEITFEIKNNFITQISTDRNFLILFK